MRTRALALALVLAAAPTLLACGGDDDAAKETTTTTAEETTTTKAEADDSGATDAELTEAGAELAVGDTATVPFSSDDELVPVEITVEGIEQGPAADLAELDLGDDAAGMVPWYVRVTIANPGSTDLSFQDPGGNLDGLDDQGDPAGLVILMSSFEPCDSESAPDSFVDGASYETCLLYLVPEAGALQGVQYQEFDTPYYDDPVVWTAA